MSKSLVTAALASDPDPIETGSGGYERLGPSHQILRGLLRQKEAAIKIQMARGDLNPKQGMAKLKALKYIYERAVRR